jgi:hypothetical protein
MVLIYLLLGNGCVFYGFASSSLVVNQKSVVERELEWGESSAVKEEGFG